MRRRVLAVAVVAMAALALAACGTPAGVDGNLTNEWPALPEAKIPVPTAPACYAITESDPTTVTKWPAPVACTEQHNVELAYVGQFTGADAERTTPPAVGSPARRKAYEECAGQAKNYLGDDWRTGRLDLALDIPIALHWEAGARWFRCDIQEFKDLEDFEVVTRTASVKGGLTGNSELRLGCMAIKQAANKDIDTMLPTACGAPHNGEFAGLWDAPDASYPNDANARKNANLAGCRGVVATFANIPNDGNFTYRTGQVATPFNKASWELGNRGVRCYIWLNKSVTNTLKGVGTAGLPINYG